MTTGKAFRYSITNHTEYYDKLPHTYRPHVVGPVVCGYYLNTLVNYESCSQGFGGSYE